jgi:hypothetical protein
MSKAGTLIIAVVFTELVVPDHRAHAGSFMPLVTEDALQTFPNDQDNFEQVLSGDQTGRLTGQFLNSFPAPNSVTASFDATTNTTIVHFAGPAISTDQSTYYTFGFAINALFPALPGPIVNPGLTDSYWTPGPLPLPGLIPTVNTSSQYLTASNQVLVTLSNDPGTFSLSSVGYLVTNSPFSLASLNRTTLPPTAFLPSGVPDGTTLTSGASTAFLISGVHAGQYVTIFSDAKFSGSSSNQPYQSLSGNWLEFQAIPEPSSCVLMAMGTATLLGGIALRRYQSHASRRLSSPYLAER